MSSFRRRRGSRASSRQRQGMTLLELVLALALSTFVMYAIGWAIHLHLRSLDVRRTTVEEAQLARALLKTISDDLRSAVQHREQDFTGVEETLANALQAAAEELAMEAGVVELLEGADPDAMGGEGGEGGGGDTGDPRGGEGGGGGGSGGGGTAPGGGGDLGMGEEDLLGSEEDLLAEEEPIDYTADIADSGLVPPVVGLYGNAMQMQVDISRVPRMDELLTMQAANQQMASLSAPPSDIKSVAYYVRQPRGAIAGPMGAGAGGMRPTSGMGPAARATPGGAFDPFGATGGLVRRVAGRSSAVFASTAGAGALNPGVEEQIIAPEVVDIQFQYFDGFTWTDQWDSMTMGGLPFAVMVQMTLLADNRVDTAVEAPPEFLVFRQVISIPTAEPISPEQVEENLEALTEEASP